MRGDFASTCDATAVVRDRVAFWGALAEDQGRPVVADYPTYPIEVGLDGSDLSDVLDMLVDNVFAHTHEGVGFTVRLAATVDGAVLEISDDGPGFDLDSVSRRAAAGPADRVGHSGMGLDIARRTLTGVGGSFEVGDPPGAVIRLVLPRVSQLVRG